MKQLQLARDNTLVNDNYVGLEGEVTVDVDRWELRLHDGETPGGHRILNLAQLYLLFMSKDSEFGQVVFDETERGVLTRIGDKQYALRSLFGYNGIEVTNAAHDEVNNNGQDDDFYIGIDSDSLQNLLWNLYAGRIYYAGDTTGDAAALAINLPAGWADLDGSIFAMRFHIAPSNSATLAVKAGESQKEARAIRTASWRTDISRVAGEGTIGFIMRIGSVYCLIGMITPSDMGIGTVPYLTANNVQDALVELAARVHALETATGPDLELPMWKFGALSNNTSYSSGQWRMTIADGKKRVLRYSVFVEASQSPGSNPTPSSVNITVNGVVVGSITVPTLQPGQQWIGYAYGIVSRSGTAIYWSLIGADYNTNGEYAVTSRIRCGSISDNNTIVFGQFSSAMQYSNDGTAA